MSQHFVRQNVLTDDAALLLGRERQFPAKGRVRKRGPRSSLSRLRRACKFRRAPPGATSGASGVDASRSSEEIAEATSAIINSSPVTVQSPVVSVLSINIRSVLKNHAQVAYMIEQHKPDIIFLQETCLNESVQAFVIEGYYLCIEA